MIAGLALLAAIAAMSHGKSQAPPPPEPEYLPEGEAAEIVSVSAGGAAEAGVTVITEGIAIKETGPKATVKKFGEVYAFSPSFFAVRRDQPTLIEFLNLQPDDEHDFMLADPSGRVLMKKTLPPLVDTAFVFTFHREGLFPFYCTLHQPAMSGQILVLPPSGE